MCVCWVRERPIALKGFTAASVCSNRLLQVSSPLKVLSVRVRESMYADVLRAAMLEVGQRCDKREFSFAARLNYHITSACLH